MKSKESKKNPKTTKEIKNAKSTITIRTKMIVWFSLSIAVLLVILAVLIYGKTSNTVVSLSKEMSEKIIQSSSKEIGNFVEGNIREVKALAESDNVKSMNQALYKEYLKKIDKLNTSVEYYFVSDLSGNAWSTRGASFSIARRDYFRQLTSGEEQMVITNALISNSSGQPVFAIAHQIKKDGKLVGVIGASVTLDTLTNIAEEIKVGNAFGSIVDGTGLIIAHPDDNIRMKMNVLESNRDGFKDLEKIGKNMVIGKSGLDYYQRKDGEEIVGLHANIKNTPNWSLLISMPVEDMEKDANDMAKVVIGMIIVILIITILVCSYIARVVTKPIISSVEQLNYMAEGDFTKKVPEKFINRKDEFGELGRGISKMQNDMRELISNIKESTDTVNVSSDELLQISLKSTQVASEIAEAINQVSASALDQAKDAELMSNKANNLSDKMDNSSKVISEVYDISRTTNDLSEKGLGIITELNEKTAKTIEELGEINEVILDVNQYASNAESITALIDNISAQTNLLALNASIEAARAGEAGKGFAVVANEIRKLSEETAAATSDIKELIKNIQQKSNNAVETMVEVKEISGEQNESIKDTGNIFTDTSEELKNLVKRIDEVKQDMEDMQDSKEDIMGAISNVSSITEETSASTEEVSASTQEQMAAIQELEAQARTSRELSEKLKSEIDRFVIQDKKDEEDAKEI